MVDGNFPRLLRTIRHLRLSQLAWRGRYLLERKLTPGPASRPRASRAGPPVLPAAPFSVSGIPSFRSAGRDPAAALEDYAQGRFTLLNRTARVGTGRGDWRLGPRPAGRLWIITLHYHEWAHDLARVCGGAGPRAALAWRLFRAYLSDWIEQCSPARPGTRELAWNAYAIATRIGCWVRSYGEIPGERWASAEEFRRTFLRSLRGQARFLRKHLEWDLRGNHLLRDAVGLAWAGRFLAGPEAEEWRRAAAELAAAQVDEQVLPDGAHFERSTMYHLQVMEDLLALRFLLDERRVVEKISSSLARMAVYAEWLCFPGGEMPLLNDAARGATGTAAEILEAVRLSGCPPPGGAPAGGRFFPRAGVAAWRGKRWTLFFDAGEAGPEYQPGHAHADTLNMVCALEGARLFVDPGTHSYDDDERRRYDRSTAAHNTLCLDGADSSEVWAIFRLGRRARPRGVRVEARPGGLAASASHDGFDHLPGRPRHTRRVALVREGALEIADRVEGRKRHVVEGGWLLHPEWSAKAAPGGWILTREGRRARLTCRGPRDLRLALREAPYHPAFHVEEQTRRLCWRWEGKPPLEVQTRLEVL